jgi:membrane-bound metal-dependent hydrolase YbcI (DUF457 family)
LEPVTQALTSFALARALQPRLPRFGTALLITAALAPDLDYASYFAGPRAFLTLHRTALHSIPGAALLACGLAGLFCFLDKRWPPPKTARKSPSPLHFAPAVALCATALLAHDLLDLASGEGLQLLWPFRVQWLRGNLAENFDPWILVLLIAGLLIPQLFRLVREEIGARKKRSGSATAVAILLVLAAYFGARAYFHNRALDLLLSSEYHARVALSAGAFPSSANPLDWRGIVSTDSTLEELDVNLAAASDFNPDRSLTHYKPPDSPALQAAEKTPAAERFLRYAQFPLASVAHREDGFRVELRDLRFPSDDVSPANITVRADLNSESQLTRAQLLYAVSLGRE